MAKSPGGTAAIAMLLACSAGTAAKAPALEPPAPTVLAEARSIVDAMEAASRGPYSRIRWFCNDGTIHPPQPYACSERGGGVQHGEYSPARQRLADLGWHVGTVLAATSWDELWTGQPRQRRLRALPIERYLVDVEDGWVMRGARTYRGHVQIEDEERFGRELLLRMLGERDWVRDNYLVARELVRVLPHGGAEDQVRRLRREAQEIAERAPTFEPMRIEIHTRPGPASARGARAWADAARRSGDVDASVIDQALTLADDLETLYGSTGSSERLTQAVAKLPPEDAVRATLTGLDTLDPVERIGRLGLALRHVRESVVADATPGRRLQLLDLATEIETRLVAAAVDYAGQSGRTRRERMDVARHLLNGVYGAGLLSGRERESLTTPLTVPADATAMPTDEYVLAVRQLRRSGDWAAGSVRFHFAEALAWYGALEPAAWRFVDDVLRSSALFPLAELTRGLSLDADDRAGLTHRFFGASYGATLGLSPGVARGTLRVVRPADLANGIRLKSDEIVVLPEAVSELDPVAGILSLAGGNLLSHVQLLARNLGIPNATIPARLLSTLVERDGQTVLFVVGPRGSVFIDAIDAVPAAVLEALRGDREAATAKEKVSPPVPALEVREPIPLDRLNASLSGKVVGPKAANLGELARRFPGRVSPAIALPFGIFAEHVDTGDASPRQRLDRAFAAFRAGDIDRTGLDAEVEQVRLAIRGLTISPAQRDRLVLAMRAAFGPDDSYGVFVRSDTNVEDLPGFTGAGLNETVPNVVGLEAQLAAIPRVWSSPFTARAMGWRSAILTRPEEVYTSVLLQKSVPVTKSGVLVTTDLGRRAPGVTVAMAWGVGGAVDGESAEQIAITPAGDVRLLAEAKAPYQRRLEPAGGVAWVPAAAGVVLDPGEIETLRSFATEVRAKLEPSLDADGKALPWDVELGFVDGRLMLFQVRPLVERGDALADRMIDLLIPAGHRGASRTPLDAPPATDADTDDGVTQR